MSHPIPNAALDDRLGFLGTSGSGKTYNAGVAVERLLARKARVVIVDPLGVWWGLRLLADGKKPSPHEVVIFGGPRGDLPLNEHAGALLGETAATMAESCIIDLRELGSKASERRFMTAFLETIYRKASGEPFHLVVDEADLFAPQKPHKGDETLLGLMENIVRRGRVKGFIPWLISQRPAVLNKNVLSQVDGLVAFKLTASQDRDALDSWIEGQADKAQGKALKDALPAMQIGQGVVWLPGHGVLKTATFPQKDTFDSSRTPKRGEKMKRTAALKPIDLSALKDKLSTVVAETKANDPKELRNEIARLRAEVKKRQTPVAAAPKIDQKTIDAAYQRGVKDGAGQAQAVAHAAFKAIAAEISKHTGAFKIKLPTPAIVKPVAATPVARVSSAPAQMTEGLSGPQQKILDAIAWWNAIGTERPSRIQVAVVAGYKPNTGTFNTYIGSLNSGSFINSDRGLLSFTDQGRASANAPGDIPTQDELHRRVLGILSGPQAKLLSALIERYPDTLSREELAIAAGYAPNTGTFNTYIGSLNSIGLIENDRGQVKAAEILFPPHYRE